MFKQLFRNKNTKWYLLVLIVLVLVLSDYFLHGYYNTEGYRGEVLKEKKAGEYRIACFGGSTTFGYWVEATEAWPAQLEKMLQKKGAYQVINLGANNQGVFGISHDIKSYEYLHYDMAIIYDGYNDREPDQLSEYNFRGGDIFFSTFVYKTILGFYLKEVGRKTSSFFTEEEAQPVFEKELSKDSMKNSLSTYYSVLNAKAEEMLKEGKFPYQLYIHRMDEVLQYLVAKKIRTVVVCQPGTYNSIQQQLVRKMIKEKYSAKVEQVNLSDLFPDISKVSFDGMHLTAEGNSILAAALCDSLFHRIH